MTDPEGNGPVPHDRYVMLGGITLEELRRIMSEAMDKAFDELTEITRRANQRSASLEQDTRQARLAMEADVKKDTKTRKRMEGAAAAQRVISGDNSFAHVDTDPIRLTSFGDDFTGPPAFSSLRYDVLVDNSAVAPKPCQSPAGMHLRTATGGLLPAGKASTATRTTFGKPLLRVYPTEVINMRTSNQYATDYSSFWKIEFLQAKSMQTLMPDPGSFKGRLRVCRILGT